MAPSLEEIAAVYGTDHAPAILAAILQGVHKRQAWHHTHAAGEHVEKVAEAAGTGHGDGYDQDQGLEGGPLARFWYLSADCSYTPGLIYDSETEDWQIAAWGDIVEEFDTPDDDDDDPDPDPLEEFRGYQPPSGPFAEWIIAVQTAYLTAIPKTEPRPFGGGLPAPGQSWWDRRRLDFEPLTLDALRTKIEAVCAAYIAKRPEGAELRDPVRLGQDIAWDAIEEDDGVIFDALWEAWLDDGHPSFELVAGWIRVTL